MMHRTMSLFLLLILSAALSGCGALGRWFASNSAVQLDLSGVRSVKIADSWVGLSPVSPLLSFYDLTAEDGAWVGTGLIEAGRPILSREEAISVPADAVARFVDILKRAVLVEGEYEAVYERTDDYPVITLTFETAHGTVKVSTGSNTVDNVPWRAEIDGVEYIIDSDVPARALDEIVPYLKYDVRQALIEEIAAEANSE
jgi:hypothetical protein